MTCLTQALYLCFVLLSCNCADPSTLYAVLYVYASSSVACYVNVHDSHDTACHVQLLCHKL